MARNEGLLPESTVWIAGVAIVALAVSNVNTRIFPSPLPVYTRGGPRGFTLASGFWEPSPPPSCTPPEEESTPPLAASPDPGPELLPRGGADASSPLQDATIRKASS